jgi:hypothetical protein
VDAVAEEAGAASTPCRRHSPVTVALVVLALRRAEGGILEGGPARGNHTVLYRLMRTNDVGHGLLGRMGLIIARAQSLLAANVDDCIPGDHDLVAIGP